MPMIELTSNGLVGMVQKNLINRLYNMTYPFHRVNRNFLLVFFF